MPSSVRWSVEGFTIILRDYTLCYCRYQRKRYIYKKDTLENGIPDFEKLSEKETFGLVAQDLEKVFPELVLAPNPTNGYYSINYIGMIPILLEAIKEQQNIIENIQQELQQKTVTLEQQTELQQNSIALLQQKIEYLEKTLIKCCNTIQNETESTDESNTIREFNLDYTTNDNIEEIRVYQKPHWLLWWLPTIWWVFFECLYCRRKHRNACPHYDGELLLLARISKK